MLKLDYRTALIFGLCLISVIAASLLPAIAQDPSYHLFSDSVTLWGIPHFWNTVSNLPFLYVGAMGYIKLNQSKLNVSNELSLALRIFYAGVFFVGVGSGYYHLNPNNVTLVWDRLPMTIGFMALFSVVIAEYISIKTAKALLPPLIFAGVLSVAYWYISESNHQGDLRPYALVQFLPMLVIPVILLSYKHPFEHAKGYWLLIACYGMAKVLEHFDPQIHSALAIMSGHALKHAIAALGIGLFTFHLETRRLRES